MVVQHNLRAMNSNRMLGVTTNSQAKSTEKLSSGYKINRAADDAAGLSISEKMRKQIRGLSQASANAQDGISAVQTAEGALNEVQDMLQRMNELAVKSANGTMSENDRSYVQNEVDQLVTEIDRVAETTKFNETYLLKGDKTAAAEYSFQYAGGGTTYSAVAGKLFNADGTAVAGGAAVNTATQYYSDIKGDTAADGTAVTGGAGTYKAAVKLYGADGSLKYDVNASVPDAEQAKLTTDYYTSIAGNTTVSAADLVTATYTTSVTAATAKYYDKDGNAISENALSNYVETADGATITAKAGTTLYDNAGNIAAFNAADFSAHAQTGALTVKLHVGADSTDNNQISVELHAMSAAGIGVAGLRVDGADDTNARDAIDTVKEAIQKVSTQRSALGAAQNRLEHTINNLDNVVENTTSAESSIRDTNMATEMVKYSNNNILSQAGQAMLAQSNQANQGVLSLLQ